MQPFELPFPGNRKTTGLLHLPKTEDHGRTATPLIVAIHGGTYTASYFDANEEYSIRNISNALRIPVVCINRPGYDESSVQPGNSGDTWCQSQGRFFHEMILPAIWEAYGGAKTNTTSIVLHGHSVGGGVTIATAACYSNDPEPDYPLSGIVTSGISWVQSKALATQAEEDASDQEDATDQGANLLTSSIKDHIMLNADMNLCTPSIFKTTSTINAPIPSAETLDIQKQWFEYWRELASEVFVPHLNVLPEHDRLWKVSEDINREFANAFKKCPRMEVSTLPEAPHCIELSRQAEGWYLRSFGFAVECAVAMEVRKERSSH